jgi:hypothetical protein
MFTEFDGASDRARGADLARAAEALLAEARLDTIDVAHAVQLATASALLALYWEMRNQRPYAAAPDQPERRPTGRRRVLASDPGA